MIENYSYDHPIINRPVSSSFQAGYQTGYQIGSNGNLYLNPLNTLNSINLLPDHHQTDIETNTERTNSVILNLPNHSSNNCCDNKWLCCCQTYSPIYLNTIFIKIKNLIERCSRFDLNQSDVSFVLSTLKHFKMNLNLIKRVNKSSHTRVAICS